MSNRTITFTILYVLLIIAAFLNITACDGSLNSEIESPVIGTWILKDYAGDVSYMMRSDQFAQDSYGFTFHKNGVFTERKNAGWCGTPPITYANFEGHWWKISDNIYHIDVEYWGGRTNFRIEIVSQNSYQLQIKYHFHYN